MRQIQPIYLISFWCFMHQCCNIIYIICYWYLNSLMMDSCFNFRQNDEKFALLSQSDDSSCEIVLGRCTFLKSVPPFSCVSFASTRIILLCLLILGKLKWFIDRLDAQRPALEDDKLADKARNSIRALYLICFLVPSANRFDSESVLGATSALAKNGLFDVG